MSGGAHVVVGAHQFAGLHTVQALREVAPVKALVPPGWRAEGEQPGVDWVDTTLEDPEALAEAFAGAEVVYVCAETPPDLRLSPIPPRPLLLQGAVQAARRAKVRRLVHVSTADVLGSDQRGRMSEVSKPRPENSYERMKLREEQHLRTEVDDVDWVIVRPVRAVGLHDRLWSEHLIPKIKPGARVWQVAGGRVYQTFIAGADLGRALVAAGKRGQPHHTYLAGGFDSTWRALLETAAAELGVHLQVQPVPFDLAFLHASALELATGFGRSRWPNGYAVDAFGKPHLYDDSRSRRQLTWSPQVGSFAEAIPEVVRALRGTAALSSGLPGRSPS